MKIRRDTVQFEQMHEAHARRRQKATTIIGPNCPYRCVCADCQALTLLTPRGVAEDAALECAVQFPY